MNPALVGMKQDTVGEEDLSFQLLEDLVLKFAY